MAQGQSYLVLGLDIGFSEARRTSGLLVAEVRDSVLYPVYGPFHLTASDARARARSAFEQYPIHVVAIDAPVASTPQAGYRPAEMVFSRGRFQTHCKPGNTASLIGQGLHAAGMEMISALGAAATYANLGALAAFNGVPAVEVFPTAALGVLFPFGSMNGVGRTKKSEALFARLWRERQGRIGSIRLDPSLQPTDHDEQMAVICCALAALYVERRCSAVGEDVSGYFLMPHVDDWLPAWQEELATNLKRVPQASVWSATADILPRSSRYSDK